MFKKIFNKNSGRILLILSLLLLHFNISALDVSVCRVILEDDKFILQNDQLRQIFEWNNGNLQFLELQNLSNNKRIITDKPQTDLFLAGETATPENGRFSSKISRKFPNEAEYLEVKVEFEIDQLYIKRVFELHPGVPAFSSYYAFKGKAKATDWTTSSTGNELGLIENMQLLQNTENISGQIGSIPLQGNHWKVEAVSFKESTDHYNNLVHKKTFIPYRKPEFVEGNIILAQNKLQETGIFILKEAPLSFSQHKYPGYDFKVLNENISIYGIGLSPALIKEDIWIRGYGFAVGITNDHKDSLLIALRKLKATKRNILRGRDEMILMNTWGDRSQDSRMNENFILEEIKVGSRLGITHLQLDDGWQKGLSKNSAQKAGMLWDDWKVEDWQPHPERFPKGFDPIVKAARKANIQICLWFTPSKVNHYANWERDAEILINYYKKYGIKVFKIDGINFSNKMAEVNLRNLFEKVMLATAGNATFNLDVTAEKRIGYHYFSEYGNIFLENRYTDWGNYYPHQTLRNLWMLSFYVPAEKLQIEFLNKWRNPQKYEESDPLAPQNIPFDYQVAISFMAQPLAWLESTQLPEEAFSVAPMIKKYKEIQHDIHSGIILPIGNEPDGFSWTGFQSIKGNEGYILIFRENSEAENKVISTRLSENTGVKFEHIFGDGKSFSAKTNKIGEVNFSLPHPHNFALYFYKMGEN